MLQTSPPPPPAPSWYGGLPGLPDLRATASPAKCQQHRAATVRGMSPACLPSALAPLQARQALGSLSPLGAAQARHCRPSLPPSLSTPRRREVSAPWPPLAHAVPGGFCAAAGLGGQTGHPGHASSRVAQSPGTPPAALGSPWVPQPCCLAGQHGGPGGPWGHPAWLAELGGLLPRLGSIPAAPAPDWEAPGPSAVQDWFELA